MADCYLVDVFRDRLQYPDLRRKVATLAAQHGARTIHDPLKAEEAMSELARKRVIEVDSVSQFFRWSQQRQVEFAMVGMGPKVFVGGIQINLIARR